MKNSFSIKLLENGTLENGTLENSNLEGLTQETENIGIWEERE